MPKTITISVTQADIDWGHPCNAGSCPVALAAKRAFVAAQVPHNESLTVTRSSIFPTENAAIRFILPKAASEFIELFDAARTNKVSPFSFEVEV